MERDSVIGMPAFVLLRNGRAASSLQHGMGAGAGEPNIYLVAPVTCRLQGKASESRDGGSAEVQSRRETTVNLQRQFAASRPSCLTACPVCCVPLFMPSSHCVVLADRSGCMLRCSTSLKCLVVVLLPHQHLPPQEIRIRIGKAVRFDYERLQGMARSALKTGPE